MGGHKTAMKHATLESNIVTGIFASPQSFATELVPDHVSVGWVKSGNEWTAIPEPLPDAEKYQVLDWLDDHGITSADVDAALQSIPDETQRRKALLRWHSVNRIPADNAFVIHVASQLKIDHRTAWAQILAK